MDADDEGEAIAKRWEGEKVYDDFGELVDGIDVEEDIIDEADIEDIDA